MLFFVKASLEEQPAMPRDQYLGMVASTWQVIKQLEGNGKVISGGAFVTSGAMVIGAGGRLSLTSAMYRLRIAGERAHASSNWCGRTPPSRVSG